MKLPTVASLDEWNAARHRVLVEEKDATRARDALAAKRRRLPMVKVDKAYWFGGPQGQTDLPGLFDRRRELIVYRFFFDPGMERFLEAGCAGCSMFADQVGHLAHLNARDVTLVLVSAAPVADIERFRSRMGWDIPWYATTDDYSGDFDVPEYFGLNVFLRDGDDVFRTYFTDGRGIGALGSVWTFLDLVPFSRQERWERSHAGYPQDPPYSCWKLHDEYARRELGSE
jgi:predicted dithiol-disulfide oxidoreductase (DUF899 family)